MKIETKIKRACLNRNAFKYIPEFGIALDKKNNVLYSFIKLLNNEIGIVNKSTKLTIEEQISELFPGIDFDTTNCYNLFHIYPANYPSAIICCADNNIESIKEYVEL